MNPFYKLLLAIFLLPLFSVAQSNYKPGNVVTLKGDTIKGFIDYREWNANPNSINFKTAITDDKATRYTPQDITAFTVSGLEWYQLYVGKITADSVDPDHIQEGRDSSTKSVSVFLRIIQKGKRLTLYSYADDIKTRFFIKEAGGQQITELIFRRYFNPIAADASADTKRTINESTYLNQLYSIAQKYSVINDSFQWDIDHADYNKSAIFKICSQINGLSDADLKKQAGNGKNKIQLFAGIALNSATTNAYSGYLAAGGKPYTSNSPYVSFGGNFFANPNTGKLIFRLELSLGQNQYKSVYLNNVYPKILVNYSFKQTEIVLTPQVIYNFYNAENFKIYGGMGFALTDFKYSNVNFQSADGTVPGYDITSYDPYIFINFAVLVTFKVGIQFDKKWGIYAGYITKSNNSKDTYFQTNVTTEQVGVNYAF